MVNPILKIMPIATFKLFVNNIPVKSKKSITCAILNKFFLPYTSASRGIHKSERHHPMKNEDPIIPILNFDSHIKSNF